MLSIYTTLSTNVAVLQCPAKKGCPVSSHMRQRVQRGPYITLTWTARQYTILTEDTQPSATSTSSWVSQVEAG